MHLKQETGERGDLLQGQCYKRVIAMVVVVLNAASYLQTGNFSCCIQSKEKEVQSQALPVTLCPQSHIRPR